MSTLIVVGLCFEIAGVFIMSSGYLVVPWYQAPWVLVKCFFNKNTIKGLKLLGELNQDSVVTVLRGLAIIALGFLMQLLGTLGGLIAGSPKG